MDKMIREPPASSATLETLEAYARAHVQGKALHASTVVLLPCDRVALCGPDALA